MSGSEVASLTLNTAIFRKFLFYGGLTLGKMFFMSFWTAKTRISKGIFANKEDVLDEKAKIRFDDQDVERLRRNHLNDMENILPFLILAPLYIFTGPSEYWATRHFQAFFVSRILHTITYQFAVPQPSRVLAFMVGVVVNVSMLYQVIKAGSY